LRDYIERRNALASRYGLALRALPLDLPTIKPENRSAFHLYVVRMATKSTGKTHRQVFEELRRRGIGVNLHYAPVHLQPYYRQLGFHRGQYPEAEAHAESALTLPLYPTMTELQQDSVVAALQAAL
jgi:dTDP-4-amino-4,6-dideoxygalactose transaminase